MSIYIDKNQNNALYFTLNENKVLTGATYYLLEIYSKNALNSKVVRLSGDTSYNQVRFNQFFIDEVELIDEDLNNGKVNLESGEYTYSVYDTLLPTGTTISGLTSLESGLLVVNGTVLKQEVKTYKDNNDNGYKFFK